MEISAQELRIGNYINGSIGDDSELVLCYVTGYDPRDEFIFVSNDNNIHYAEFVDFQPIPLTEEWLLKFEFQRHDEGSVSAQFSYGTNPVTQDYIIYLKWIKDYENDYQLNGFPFYQNGHFEIKTVHQLQNLYFSLCGEELIIKQLA